jgi:hypothetical protein
MAPARNKEEVPRAVLPARLTSSRAARSTSASDDRYVILERGDGDPSLADAQHVAPAEGRKDVGLHELARSVTAPWGALSSAKWNDVLMAVFNRENT